MQWPISRTRVDALGVKMRDDIELNEDETEEFTQVLEFYEDLAGSSADRVEHLGLSATSRGKTTGTTIEKLKRERTTKLSRINDMAGVRVVVGSRREQIDAVSRISKEYAGETRSPQTIDRINDPRHGYRAIHIVVYPSNVPVEIQVRTYSQNLWAQIFESVADRWGRQIRYGEPPDEANRIVRVPNARPSHATRADVVEMLVFLAGELSAREQEVYGFANLAESFDKFREEQDGSAAPAIAEITSKIDSGADPADIKKELHSEYRQVRGFAKQLAKQRRGDRRVKGRFVRRNFPTVDSVSVEYLDAKVGLLFDYFRELTAVLGRVSIRQGARLSAILQTVAEFEETENFR